VLEIIVSELEGFKGNCDRVSKYSFRPFITKKATPIKNTKKIISEVKG
jgi:hypothetical protein